MEPETPHLRAVLSSLPSELAGQLQALLTSHSAEATLDMVIRFICGADVASSEHYQCDQQRWSDAQSQALKILTGINLRSPSPTKRPRDDDLDSTSDSQTAKRPRLPPTSTSVAPAEIDGASSSLSVNEDPPIFTLHSISTTSPVRKKADITIHKASLKFSNPASHALEVTIPLSSINRAFLLPTRGKQKPHWTVVLLSSDVPDKGKPSSASAQASPQIIYGMDATTATAVSATTYDVHSTPLQSVFPKGSQTLPIIRDFLAHLGTVQILEPTPGVFKSVCAGAGTSAASAGIPGVEAYRAAKAGSLWFMSEGILWGESKPCEFWAVEDLIGKTEGVRIVSATGRTCSVILTRKSSHVDENDEEGEDMGEEAEFGMVDGREQEGINQWVRQHRHLFGKQKMVESADQMVNGKPMTIGHIEDDSDEEDEDFEMDSDENSDGVSSGDTSDEEGVGSGKEAEESEAEGSGDEESGDAEGEDEEEELHAKDHPLMRPGAMPKMSRAAIDMVVSMVEGDMMGAAGGAETDEEDELED